MATVLTDVRGLLRQAMRFLLPVDCAACGVPLAHDPVPLFCARCWSTIAPLVQAHCARCNRPFASPATTTHSPTHVCQACTERPPFYTRAWTLYPYVPPLQDAICLFKYRGNVSLASALADLMINRFPPLSAVDMVIPVPLHPRRLREREFNQSLLLADLVARHLKIPVAYTNLVRLAPSLAQTTLARKSRLKNVRGAFAVNDPRSIAGKRVLLVDDVFTTGSTVNECAKVLRQAQSGDVFVMTLARTMDASLVPDRILAQRTRTAPGQLGG